MVYKHDQFLHITDLYGSDVDIVGAFPNMGSGGIHYGGRTRSSTANWISLSAELYAIKWIGIHLKRIFYFAFFNISLMNPYAIV